MSAAVTITGDLATITFGSFTLDDYPLFLRTKKLPESRLEYDVDQDRYTITTPARFAERLGLNIEAPERSFNDLAPHLFDYQAWAVSMALRAKRFAVWFNTGLGKTAVQLEWARQVHLMSGGKVLMFAPLAVIPQTIEMAREFYGGEMPIAHLTTREHVTAWCLAGGNGIPVAMTNYEKLNDGQMPGLRHLAGIVADESSMLKTGGGVRKWNLIHSSKGIEYKLSLTATPAPNDAMEYASQASFLETIRHEGEVFWTFFSKDKYGNWAVKPHAREAFYRFLSSWSLYMHDPANFGFGDILAGLPDPIITEERIPLTDDQRRIMTAILAENHASMFADDKLGVVPRSKLAQLARGFLYGKQKGTVERWESHKPHRVAQIVRDELNAGRQVLVWSTFDEEAPILRKQPPLFPHRSVIAELTGKQSEATRLETLERFRAGEIRCLISKPQLIGYGLNLQFVRSMVFSGFDDSFERAYQAIRRAYRFGQTEPVRVFWPYVPELEGVVFTNIRQKEVRFMADVAQQERSYREALIASGELAP